MKKIIVFIGASFLLISCATSSNYPVYIQPSGSDVVVLEAKDRVNALNFMKQKSDNAFDVMVKSLNAVNSITLSKINAGIYQVDGAYIKNPKVLVKSVEITPGFHTIAVAAFLGNSGKLYDEIGFDFRANEKYIVDIEPFGSNNIQITIYNKGVALLNSRESN